MSVENYFIWQNYIITQLLCRHFQSVASYYLFSHGLHFWHVVHQHLANQHSLLSSRHCAILGTYQRVKEDTLMELSIYGRKYKIKTIIIMTNGFETVHTECYVSICRKEQKDVLWSTYDLSPCYSHYSHRCTHYTHTYAHKHTPWSNSFGITITKLLEIQNPSPYPRPSDRASGFL